MSNTNARASFPSIFAFSSISNHVWWTTSTNTTGNMSTSYKIVAGITRITPPKLTRGTVDITDMNSVDYYEDNALAGPVRTGTVAFDVNYLSTSTHQRELIPEAFEAGTEMGWLIQMAGTSSGNVYYGDGVISGYSFSDLTQDGKIGITFELKTKGKCHGPVDSTAGPTANT
jgi:hypothetical protein